MKNNNSTNNRPYYNKSYYNKSYDNDNYNYNNNKVYRPPIDNNNNNLKNLNNKLRSLEYKYNNLENKLNRLIKYKNTDKILNENLNLFDDKKINNDVFLFELGTIKTVGSGESDKKTIQTNLEQVIGQLFKGIDKEKKEEKKKEENEVVYNLSDTYEEVEKKMNTLDDLIELGKSYNKDSEIKYSFDIKMLNNLVEPLEKLNKMIGLDNIKKSVVEFIIYHSQHLERQNNDMFHTVIQGPPGVGKTEIAKILGNIYTKIGVTKNNKFKIVKRSDLIGKFLGHTATKTQEIIDECEGGVLFIDEAYSLGNDEGKDMYAKECIDTLNLNLSENKKNFICIIAGYKDSLDKCFFSYNEGLRRRFSFKYTINKYSPLELSKIFVSKVSDLKFEFDESIVNSKELEIFFQKNKDNFLDFGGDIETLLLNCKIAHSNRIFGKHPKNRKKFTKKDIMNGLDRFILHKQLKNNDILDHLYI
jgi:hypothetical protein